MTALSDLIDFLLELLRDDDAAAAFAADPDQALADRGLDGVTAQDVRDARLVLADEGGAHHDGGPPSGGHDAVGEIHYTRAHYTAGDAVGRAGHDEPDLIDRSTTIVTIDDRDTTIVQNTFSSDDDVTIVNDSFNSTDNSVVQDNSVTETNVVAIDADNSFNEDIDTNVVAIDADNSFNEDSSTDVDVVAIDLEPPAEAPPAPEEPGIDEPEPVDPEPVDDAPLDPALDGAVV